MTATLTPLDGAPGAGADEGPDGLWAAARALLGDAALVPPPSTDPATARQGLAALWRALLDEAARRPGAAGPVVALLDRVRAAERALEAEDSRHRQARLGAVRDALERLRTVDSQTRLLQLAPEVVCSLGFDRAIVSRVEESTWVTEACHLGSDPDWAREVLAVGRAHPQRLGPELRESEMIRRRTGMLVTDAQADPRIHRPIAEASRTRAYVAAPVVVGTQVVGFVHADRFFDHGDVGSADRDVLELFAQGLGLAMERARALDERDAVRAEVGRIGERLVDLAGPPGRCGVGGGPDPDTAGTQDGSPGGSPAGAARWSARPAARLTPRELDVIRMMAAGDTNRRIAARLVLSEGTVKSHVKHILRKLGAANRAEAVSTWLLASGRTQRG